MRELPNWNRKPTPSDQLDQFFEEVTLNESYFKEKDIYDHIFKYSNMLADKISNFEPIIVKIQGKEKKVKFNINTVQVKGKLVNVTKGARGQEQIAAAWKAFFQKKYKQGKFTNDELPSFVAEHNGETVFIPFTSIEKTKNGFSGKAEGTAPTEVKESWQGIGFYIWSPLEKRFQKILADTEAGNLEEAVVDVNKMKKELYKFINEDELPEPPDATESDVKDIVAMLDGSVVARRKLLGKDSSFSGDKLYVIRSSIREYYKEMERIGGPEEEIAKPNTSDIIISNSSDLLGDLKRIKDGNKNAIKYNNKTGICVFKDIKFMQISFKLEKAQFGNVRKYLINITGVTNKSGLPVIGLQSPEVQSEELREIYSPYHELLQEGIWDTLRNAATQAYTSMRSAYQRGVEFTKSLIDTLSQHLHTFTQGILDFMNSNKKKVEQEAFNLIQSDLSQMMSEDIVKVKKPTDMFDQLKAKIRDMKVGRGSKKDEAERDLKKYAEVITKHTNNNLKILKQSLDPKYMKFVIGIGKKKGMDVSDIQVEDVLEEVNRGSLRPLMYLYVNLLSFMTIIELLKMIKANRGGGIKKAIEIFEGIKKTTMMGYTFLPIVRVRAGLPARDPNVLTIDEKEAILDVTLFDEKKPYMVVSIKKSDEKNNFLVDLCVFAGMDTNKPDQKNYTYLDFNFQSRTEMFSFEVSASRILPMEYVYNG